MARHTLLQRQIRRHLDGVDVTAAPWAPFLAAVDESYATSDRDRALLESAMELSSAELLEANAELRGLVQVFPDLILHVNAADVITARRGGLLPAFTPPEGTLVGQSLRAFFAGDEAEALDRALAAARDTGRVGTVSRTVHDSQGTSAQEIRLAPLGDGGVIAIVRDVTDVRRSEELRLARDGAEAASRAKSAFLANMSHELRTPLNAVLGYSEMLAEYAPDDMREDLRRIHRSGKHLLQIINSMLEIARIEAGMVTVEREAVDAQEIAADAIETVRTAAAGKALSCECVVEPQAGLVETDRAKLMQVLVTLLGNAVKFTERGHVRLELSALERDGRPGVAFAVRDTGIGIRADHLVRLFQDFAQVDESSTRRFGGTGLGLALCRRLCALLGGRIDVQSTFGAGSVFTVWVPRAASGAADGGGQPRAQAVAGGVS